MMPGPSPATPQLLEAFGIGGWPLVRQKAWAQLIRDKPGTLSPSDHALLRVLNIEPAGQLEWLQSERSKFAAAAFIKDERAALREFVFESSQTVDDMLRALDGHEDFRGVGDSSMQHEARFDLVKKSEDKLPAIIPLKGDREFLMRELKLKKNLKKPARKLAAPPVSYSPATNAAEPTSIHSMGFDPKLVARALKLTRGNVEQATNLILEGEISSSIPILKTPYSTTCRNTRHAA